MKELKCPKCGNVFQVDEADYASIVSQVRGKEFDAELKQREESIRREMEAKEQAAKAITDARIEQLKTQLETIVQTKDAEKATALATQENDIATLRAQIQQEKTNTRIAVLEAESKAREEIQQQKDKVRELENKAKLQQQEVQLNEKSIRDQYETQLKLKDEVIAQYKDFKTSLSTKMIGESLEVYCHNQFDIHVRPYMPEAYFGKDNDVVEGTKGDFVFRDIVEGIESVSIMFEMKNEADDTEKKHKNAGFFDKLDKDRKKKNCEYAILVSMLELDNELYNNGIYAVPGYEKMFVIRPQQFLTIIAILTQMGRNTVSVKKELKDAREKEIDVTHFEENVTKFKNTFSKHINDAATRYNKALKDIDKAIEQLTNMREDLRLWVGHLYEAENNFNDLEIKKLTKGNPTMETKFLEARNLNAQEGIEEIID